MDVETLRQEFHAAEQSESLRKHQSFARKLLASNENDVVALHFSLLKERDNWDLFLTLRDAFAKRGAVAERFLRRRIEEEKDPVLQGEALHLLGYLRSKEAAPWARKLIRHKESDHREIASYVLGWVGGTGDLALLREALLHDDDPEVRTTAATSLDQMRMRLPDVTEGALSALKEALRKEKKNDVIAWIIITIQYILEEDFGLEEVIEEGEYRGNVRLARERAMKALGLA